jgi:hypothetical protein
MYVSEIVFFSSYPVVLMLTDSPVAVSAYMLNLKPIYCTHLCLSFNQLHIMPQLMLVPYDFSWFGFKG